MAMYLTELVAPLLVRYLQGVQIILQLSISVGHNQSIAVQCLAQFQPTTNLTTICNNGTWSSLPKCIPAKCTELPNAPRNGMVVAPNLDHGMVGKFEVKIVSIKRRLQS